MEHRIQTVCLVILTTVVIGAALAWLAPVMIPFTLSAFIALGLRPLVDVQVRTLHLPRGLALGTTLIAGGGLLVLLGTLVAASVGQLSANADLYADRLKALVEVVLQRVPADVARELETLTQAPVKSVGRLLVGTTNAMLDLLSRSFLVLIFVTFLILGGGVTEATGVWRDAEEKIKRFLATKAVISAATGFLVGLTLTLLGIDLAMMFGLFAFLLNFIPNIGSVVATLLPLPVVIVSPAVSPTVAVLAIVIPGTIQIGIGNFVEPRVMGDELDLHPVTVILTLIVWGMLWGIVGMLLATPITAVMKIVLERFEGTRVLADVMAGRLDSLRSPATP